MTNITTTDCIIWPGYKNKAGYGAKGSTVNGKFKLRYVHRLEWEAHNGPIPRGIFVCHRCDNRACYNVAHLFLGTHEDNNNDTVAKQRYTTHLGQQHHNNKLSQEQVIGIKATLAQPRSSVYKLAKQHGVSVAAIHSIKTGRSWKWLQVP